MRGYAVGDVFTPSTFTGWAGAPVWSALPNGRDRSRRGWSPLHLQARGEARLARDTCRIESEELGRNGVQIYFAGQHQQTLTTNDGGKVQYPSAGQRSLLADLTETDGFEAVATFLTHLRDVWILRLAPWSATAMTKREDDWLARDGANFASWLRGIQLAEPDSGRAALPRLRASARRLSRARVRRLAEREGACRPLRRSGKRSCRRAVRAGVRCAVAWPAASHDALCSASLCGEQGQRALDRRARQLSDAPRGPAVAAGARPSRQRARRARPRISHHPEVIDYLAANAAYLVHRPSGGPTKVRPVQLAGASSEGLKLWEIVARGWDSDG